MSEPSEQQPPERVWVSALVVLSENLEDWHAHLSTRQFESTDVEYARVPAPASEPAGVVLIDREEAVKVICFMCADPSRYTPSEYIEAQETVCHRHITPANDVFHNRVAAPCRAIAMRALPAYLRPSASEPDSIEVPQTCVKCGHDERFSKHTPMTGCAFIVNQETMQMCRHACVFPARAGEGDAIDRGAARIAIDGLKVKIGSSGSRGYLERVTFNDALEQALLAIEGLTNQKSG